MPRAKKRTPRKSSLSKDVSEESVAEESSVGQECDESMNQNNENGDKEEKSTEIDSVDDQEKMEEAQQKEEEMATANEETEMESSEHLEKKMDELEEHTENQEHEKTEGEDEMSESKDEKQVDSTKEEVSPEEIQVTPYLPHTIPDVTDNKLKEKWEWHMRIYPIDQSDIRRCVLDSVSKIAQETWYYIDKNNYGMGSYDLCMRSFTDTAMVMLKTLRAPMLYRYVTVEVSRRAKSAAEIEKIKQNHPLPPEGSSKEESGDSEDRIEEAIEKLPYTEVVESATLHLDYYHTIQCDKVKGKEKKRSLYVKYLPECTSKELLKVLFPVAINLDIISTGAGRRVGDLDVASEDNLRGVIQAYVTVYINGCKNIGFGWKEGDLDDGVTNPVSPQESPWELLPREDEVAFEAVPEIAEDSVVQYRKRKRDMEIQHRRAAEMQMRHNRGERRRETRWDSNAGNVPPPGAEIVHLQRAMNAKIQNQLALLHAVGDRPPRPPRGPPAPPGLMGGPPDLHLRPMGPVGMRDRKRDRFERDRIDMEMPGRRRDFPPFGPGRMGPPEREMRGRPDFLPRDRDRMFEGGRGRGPPMGMYNRGGRFDRGDSERGRPFGGRIGGGDSRGRGFDFHPRGGGQFDHIGRGRGGFESRGRGRGGEAFGQKGMGRGGPPDRARDHANNKVDRPPAQSKEGGPVERIQNRDQRSGGRGGSRSKPLGHGFSSNVEKPGDSHRTLTQVTISGESQGGNKSFGQGNSVRQGGFGNRNSNQISRGNDYSNQRGTSGDKRSFQGQNRGFGSQNQRSFGGNQNQQSTYGSQSRQSSFGSPLNRQGNVGPPQSQNQSLGNSQIQSSFGSPQNQQRGYGGSQAQTNYGSSGYQQSGFGSTGNQGNYGSVGNQSTSYPSSVNQQNSYSSSINQLNSFGSSNQQSVDTSQNQQLSYGSNQQNYSNQQSNYGTIQNASALQSSYNTMQSQGYGSQQSFGAQQQSQSSYGSYNTQQQQGYNTMQQQNYNTSQSYDTQQQTYGSQLYGTQQQQQTGYSTAGTYDWSQQAMSAGTNNSATSDYSQSSLSSSQQTQQQDYSAYSTAYPGYGGTALPSAASGYGADTAFANQGLYSASQGSQSLDPYGNYSATDGYGTSNQQSGLGTYNYAQYQGNA
ncbi:stress protein DDR48 [Elysia marginata]|uniref:Stress protein DDR48 n=1 Tax=Elysia marginata TaxID=1093978 RepID=A0AAV4G647_9GAST|nr:stress protein DDR48 [Elysia marginata]